jgi:hypothetical protein
MKSICFIFTLCLFLFSFHVTHGEIEKVVLKWKPGFCTETCLIQLKRRLEAIPDVVEMKFQPSQNQATLRWEPNRKFSYRMIDTTMRSVGVSIQELFITIRGTISHKRNVVSIQSLGDGTEFILLSPITIYKGDAAVEKSIESHMLKPNTSQALITAENAEKIVTIEGPLFEGHRAPPLFLIAERIAIPPSW